MYVLSEREERAGGEDPGFRGREKQGKQSLLIRKVGYFCFNKPLVCCDFIQLKLE